MQTTTSQPTVRSAFFIGRSVAFAALAFLAVLLSAGQATAGTVVRTWVGGTSTDWATDANWNPSGVPDGDDVAKFTGTPTRNCVVTGSQSTDALLILADYTGTITIGITDSTAGTLTLNGKQGTTQGFTAANTAIEIKTPGIANLTITNTGTLSQTDSGGSVLLGQTIACSGNMSFSGNVTFASGTSFTGAATAKTMTFKQNVVMPSSITLFTPNQLKAVFARSGGSQQLTSPAAITWGDFEISGKASTATNQDIVLQAGSDLKIGGSLSVASNGTTQAALDANSQDINVSVAGNATFATGGFKPADEGTNQNVFFTMNGNGTEQLLTTNNTQFRRVKIARTGATNAIVKLGDNLKMDLSDLAGTGDNDFDFVIEGTLRPNGKTMTLNGDLWIKNLAQVDNSAGAGTGTLSFTKPAGGDAQLWRDDSGTGVDVGNVVVNGGANTVSIQPITLVKATSIDIQQGTVNPRDAGDTTGTTITLTGKSGAGFAWKSAAGTGAKYTPRAESKVIFDISAAATPATIISGEASDYSTADKSFQNIDVVGRTVQTTTNPFKTLGTLLVAGASGPATLDLDTSARLQGNVTVGGTAAGKLTSDATNISIELRANMTIGAQGEVNLSLPGNATQVSELVVNDGTTVKRITVNVGGKFLVTGQTGFEYYLRNAAGTTQWEIVDLTATGGHLGDTAGGSTNPLRARVRYSDASQALGATIIATDSVPEPTAANNPNWSFGGNRTISGTVKNANGTDFATAGVFVRLRVSRSGTIQSGAGFGDTDATIAAGAYSFTAAVAISPSDIVTVFLVDNTGAVVPNAGMSVTRIDSSADITNLNIVADQLTVFRHGTGGGASTQFLTNADLFAVDSAAIAGIRYTVTWDPLESTCRHASLSIL